MSRDRVPVDETPLTPRPRKDSAQSSDDETPRAAQSVGSTERNRMPALQLQLRSKSIARRSYDSEAVLPELLTARPSWISPPRSDRSKEIQDHLPGSKSAKVSLVDFLCVTPPTVPAIYEAGKLTHTKTISDEALKKIDQHDELHRIVPALFMMEPLIGAVHKEFGNLDIHPAVESQRDWLTSIHPYTTAHLLPKEIRSEKDTEDLVLGVLFRPLVAACHAAKMGNIDRSDDYPNLTSCSGGGAGAAIPDAMLWSLPGFLATTIEVKTQGVFVDCTHLGDRPPTFNDLLVDFQDMGTGYSVRFIWPEDKGSDLKPADRIILQVWTQMVAHQMKFAVLTNYTSVIFVVRDGHTLFMSAEYTEDRIFIAIFAFLAHVLGCFQEPASELDLPQVVDWWEKYINPIVEAPGIDKTTMPHAYHKRLRKQRKDSQSDIFW